MHLRSALMTDTATSLIATAHGTANMLPQVGRQVFGVGLVSNCFRCESIDQSRFIGSGNFRTGNKNHWTRLPERFSVHAPFHHRAVTMHARHGIGMLVLPGNVDRRAATGASQAGGYCNLPPWTGGLRVSAKVSSSWHGTPLAQKETALRHLQ